MDRAVAKAERRAERERELAGKIKPLPDKRYGVIYADPPWRFEPWSRETGMDRAADNHYPTMTMEVLWSLPVSEIATKDCALFLWATVPMLCEALTVLTQWGFSYKSHLVWDKQKIGTGYWFRNRHELLLLGTRGKPPAPRPGARWISVFNEPRTKHSAKPRAIAAMIDGYFPEAAKIELFACGKARPGWDVWGAEAT